MLWPYSAPSCIALPTINRYDDSLAYEEGRPDEILAVESSKRGYLVAVITWRALYVYRAKPFCPVAVFVASKQSINHHGEYKSLFIRSDGQAIGITTISGIILLFHVIQSGPLTEVCRLGHSFSLTGDNINEPFPGPGEAAGVRELRLKYWMLIKVDSGISHAIPLDDDIIIVTKTPRAVQLVNWRNQDRTSEDGTSSSRLKHTLLLSKVNWLTNHDDHMFVHIATSKAMSLLSISTASGRVFTATVAESSTRDNDQWFNGHVLYDDERSPAVVSAINARLSTIAVACQDGSISLYNIKDYKGSATLIRRIDPPSSDTGVVQSLEWSLNGHSLFVAYNTGWAFFSMYGMLTASSFLCSEENIKNEPWLGGIRHCFWSHFSDNLFMVSNNGTSLWELSTMKWNMTTCFSDNTLQRPILFNDRKMLIYRGHEQSDLTTIDRDALLWLNVSFPADYIAEHWPIRHLASSQDGRYIAVAGVRGLTHYSVYSGRWKLFTEEYMDHEFSVKGGMIWYEHFLIVGLATDEYTEEIQIFSRNFDLNLQNALFSVTIPGQILKMSISDSLLLVYTHDNTLYFYKIITENDSIVLELENEVSFTGIIHSPVRVRGINCLPRKGVAAKNKSMAIGDTSTVIDTTINATNASSTVTKDTSTATDIATNTNTKDTSTTTDTATDTATNVTGTATKTDSNSINTSTTTTPGTATTNERSILILVDGMLTLLEPVTSHSKDITDDSSTPSIHYVKKILHHDIEYYTITQKKKTLQNPYTLWAFDGKNLLVWLEDFHQSNVKPFSISMENYPLAVLVNKGIAIGIEIDLVFRRDAIFTYFKSWTTTELFAPYILEAYLKMGLKNKALTIASEYRKLKYFSHILEMLLYRVLLEATDSEYSELGPKEEPGDHEPLLNRAVELVSEFPEMLNVILGCTRKTEVICWPALFNVIGSPQMLFERCLDVSKLNTAAGYLLVLHNMEQYKQPSNNTIRLLKLAYESGNWDLCKELVRFLTAIDPSCELLKSSLEEIEIEEREA